MNLELAGCIVLVTGASSGIGRAIAIAFAKEGARVAITYREGREGAERTADMVREAGGEALIARFALEEPSSAAEVISQVHARWGTLHSLVNNAVYWPHGFTMFEEASFEQWLTPIHANIDGTAAMLRAALPLLRAATWGRIVTVSTGLVQDGFPGSSSYMTGKAALHGLNRTLAKELGPSGILTNILMSGAVETRERPAWLLEQMAKSAATGRMTSAEDVARTAVFLGSPANGHITGEALRCDGFFVSGVKRASP